MFSRPQAESQAAGPGSLDPRFPVANTKAKLAFVAILCLTVIFLLPLLKTGYLSDDILTSLRRGQLGYFGTSIWNSIVDTAFRTLQVQGRVTLVGVILFHLAACTIPSVAMYKLYLIAWIVLDIAIFRKLLAYFSNSFEFTVLTCAFLIPLFQYRQYHDALSTFYGIVQFTFAFTALSLIFLFKYLRSHDRKWYWASLGFYLLALQSYEMSYAFFLFHVFILALEEKSLKVAVQKAIPFFSLVLLHLVLIVFVRETSIIPRPDLSASQGFQPGAAYNMGFQAGPYFSTLGKQLFAAVPLSYTLMDPEAIFPSLRKLAFDTQWPLLDYVLLSASFLCFFICLNQFLRSDPSHQFRGLPLLLFGILLWLLPALIVSTSTKYQKEITPGIGYIPVYMEYFGVAIILTVSVRYFLCRINRARTAMIVLVSAAAAFVLISTYRANRIVVSQYKPALYQRTYVENALKAGLANAVPDRATLLVPEQKYVQHWQQRQFYYLHTGKRLIVTQDAKTAVRRQDCEANVYDPCVLKKDVYEITQWTGLDGDLEKGAVLLTKVDQIRTLPDNTRDRASREMLLYLQLDSLPSSLEHFPFVLRAKTYDGKDELWAMSEFQIVNKVEDWMLMRLDSPVQVQNSSIRVEVYSNPVEMEFTSGFFEMESRPDYSWRWCNQEAELTLINTSAKPVAVRLDMALATGFSEFANVTIETSSSTQSVRVNSSPQPFSLDVDVSPGSLERIRFNTDAAPLTSPQDPRKLYFRVDNLQYKISPR